MKEGAGGTGLNAFAAGGAAIRGAPSDVQIGDNSGLTAATGHVAGAGAFDVPADAHAARAENAAVMIHAEERVRMVHVPLREAVFVADMIHPKAAGERLQFTMAI